MSVGVIIPAFNESTAIGATLQSLRDAWPGAEPLTILVVDDLSDDDTAPVADRHGADVVLRLPERMGKGAALWAGTHAVKADRYLFLDADLGDSAGAGFGLLGPLESGEADMVIGKLPHQAVGGGSGRVVRLARRGIHQLTGFEMAAPLSGQRAISAAALAKLPQFAGGFGVEVAMTIDAHRAGLRIVEIEVPLRHRVTGRDLRSRMHRIRQYLDVRAAIRSRS